LKLQLKIVSTKKRSYNYFKLHLMCLCALCLRPMIFTIASIMLDSSRPAYTCWSERWIMESLALAWGWGKCTEKPGGWTDGR